MNNERTLSFSKSQQLTEADLQSVSAADGTIQGTLEGTYHTGSENRPNEPTLLMYC
jgi:hypothetical protein